MSAQRSLLCSCAALTYCFLTMAALPDLTAGRNCSHPLMPERAGFRCHPFPCRGFTPRSIIHFFCEPGYVLPPHHFQARCRHGRWLPGMPVCLPQPEDHAKECERNSVPSVVTTAIAVSVFFLTTTACLVVKSRLCFCWSGRSSDQLDLVVDGSPVSLPTYEEAVHSGWGQRLLPSRGPAQLLLAQDASEHSPLTSLIRSDPNCCTSTDSQITETPPPPYEEVQSRDSRSGAGNSQSALSVDKSS